MFQYRGGGVRPARRGHRGRGHLPHRPHASRRATAHRAEAPALSPPTNPGPAVAPDSWRSPRSRRASSSTCATRPTTTSCRLSSARRRASSSGALPPRESRTPTAHSPGTDMAVCSSTAAPGTAPGCFFDTSSGSQKLSVADPPNGSRHNRGSAIDLNPCALKTGEATDVIGTRDDFSRRSFPRYPGGTSRQRWLREPLRRVMEAGRRHFDQEDRREYALRNVTIGRPGGR